MPSSPDNKTGKGTWKNEDGSYPSGGEIPRDRIQRTNDKISNSPYVGHLNDSQKGKVSSNGPSLGRTANGSKNPLGREKPKPPSGH